MTDKEYADDLKCPMCDVFGKVYLGKVEIEAVSGEICVHVNCDACESFFVLWSNKQNE